MSTWKLISDTEDSYRWVIAGEFKEKFHKEVSVDHDGFIKDGNLCSRLPSMEDLLLQGRSKLIENGSEGETPMFSTALGKPLSVKPSSIFKALSVISEDDCFDTYTPKSGGNRFGFSNSCFQTGSGKRVDISVAGLTRAKQLLGLQNDSHPNNTSMERTNSLISDTANSSEKESDIKTFEELTLPKMQNHSFRPSSIKFQTAGGRSVSVSSDALKRAKSLLGDLELETSLCHVNGECPLLSLIKEEKFGDSSAVQANDGNTHFSSKKIQKSKCVPVSFTSPFLSSRMSQHVSIDQSGDAQNLMFREQNQENHGSSMSKNHSGNLRTLKSDCFGEDVMTIRKMPARKLYKPLCDISNIMDCDLGIKKKQPLIEKTMLGRRISSPFKRPRNSSFSASLDAGISFNNNAIVEPCLKRRVSARYPFLNPRTSIEEYFSTPPLQHIKGDFIKEEIKQINPMSAEKYEFHEESISCIGVEDFGKLLALEGASMDCISKEWISNHYKWIVWKLACYERSYPDKFSGRLLTVSNVLEELKYRYEREINYGHRSAIRKILAGDASPSSVMILCVSEIYSAVQLQSGTDTMQEVDTSKVELTDGWYSIDAILDKLLLKQLASGKLYIGQKIRIWGARLCGWDGPISPLEEQRGVMLMLHMNGTYRARWADRLGLCKDGHIPLAFKCIKSAGGPVRQTIIGIKRIYPVLFKERLSNGETIVMPEMFESRIMQLLNQRRSAVIERITSEFGMAVSDFQSIADCDEGAEILKMLEASAEPEVLMAEMSSEKLKTFSSYQAKAEAFRQAEIQRLVEKALDDAGLCKRDVTPFMRVRVVGLDSQNYEKGKCHREGIITIWNPTDEQQFGLVEGKAYAVSELTPLNSDRDEPCFHAKGSATRWIPLPPSILQKFKPFSSPHQAVSLCDLGGVPLASEFDTAVLVVHVGEAYVVGPKKRQWIFVADGSLSGAECETSLSSLLAINFFSPHMDVLPFAPLSHNIGGSIVGFTNIIKRPKDIINHVWVAEATVYSSYFLRFNLPRSSHLMSAAASVEKWAKISHTAVERLRQKVLFMIGNYGA